MKHKIGDRVAFNFRDHCINCGASLFAITPDHCIFKGKIEKVRTQKLLIMKLKEPEYKVCNIWVSESILKPIITVKARR